MKKGTLKSIHAVAMETKECIELLGYDRKYEWRMWGYLLALFDNYIIDYEEYRLIKKHYHKYFNELKASRN